MSRLRLRDSRYPTWVKWLALFQLVIVFNIVTGLMDDHRTLLGTISLVLEALGLAVAVLGMALVVLRDARRQNP